MHRLRLRVADVDVDVIQAAGLQRSHGLPPPLRAALRPLRQTRSWLTLTS